MAVHSDSAFLMCAVVVFVCLFVVLFCFVLFFFRLFSVRFCSALFKFLSNYNSTPITIGPTLFIFEGKPRVLISFRTCEEGPVPLVCAVGLDCSHVISRLSQLLT